MYLKTHKNRKEVAENIFYILQFIDNASFMASSLSNLVNNLADIIHEIKWKYRHDNEKCKTCRIKYKFWDCFIEHINFKDDLIEFKCLCYNKNYQQNFDEKLKEQLFNTHNFSKHDNNKFILFFANRCLSLWVYEWLRKTQ